MNAVVRLYLRNIIYSVLPLGVIMLVFHLSGSSMNAYWEFLLPLFSILIVMSLVLLTFHIYSLQKMGVQNLTDQSLSVTQMKSIKCDLNKSELFEKLKSDPTVGKMLRKIVGKSILLSTGQSWKSWGEEIEIIQKDAHPTSFEYQIISKPKLRTTTYDYGKNLENIRRIERIIVGTDLVSA